MSNRRQYREIREGLQQYNLDGLERLAQTMSTPLVQRAIVDEARDRLARQANAGYDAGAR
jgi:hypothetical protein